MVPRLHAFTPTERNSHRLGALLLVTLLTLPAKASSGGRADPGGFLLFFRVTAADASFASAAATDGYATTRHLPAAGDWTIELQSGSEAPLWKARIADPWATSLQAGPDGAIPLTIRIPNLAGATRAVLSDGSGVEATTIALDGAFRSFAGVQRANCEAHDAANCERLRSLAAAAAEPPPGRLPQTLVPMAAAARPHSPGIT